MRILHQAHAARVATGRGLEIPREYGRAPAINSNELIILKARSPLACRASTAVILLCLCMSACNAQPATEASLLAERKKMVEEQLVAPGRNIRNRRVLEAMASVPRHEFVPEGVRRFAYWDEP